MDESLGHILFRREEPNPRETILDRAEAPPLRGVDPVDPVNPIADFPIIVQQGPYTASCVAFLLEARNKESTKEEEEEKLETVFAPYLSKIHLPPIPQPKKRIPKYQEEEEEKDLFFEKSNSNRKKRKKQVTEYQPTIQDSLVAIQERL